MVKKEMRIQLRLVKKQRERGVPYRHGGGWSRKINAWHLYTLMVYL
jgi:hypothetical protein